MELSDALGLLVALGLAAYFVVAMLRPERW
jgi:K+-transporting ATPase KdpF subunit